jgi:hypothetical protein
VFPLGLTHAWPLVLPLLLGATSAYTPSDSESLLRSPLTVRPQDTLREVAQRFAQYGDASVV